MSTLPPRSMDTDRTETRDRTRGRTTRKPTENNRDEGGGSGTREQRERRLSYSPILRGREGGGARGKEGVRERTQLPRHTSAQAHTQVNNNNQIAHMSRDGMKAGVSGSTSGGGGPISYAAAAATGAGGNRGTDRAGREQPPPCVPHRNTYTYAQNQQQRRRERDYIEDKTMFRAYFYMTGEGGGGGSVEETGEAAATATPGDERGRFVVHMRYWGQFPERHMEREYIVDDLLMGHLGIASEDLRTVSLPAGIAEADLIFKSERAYYNFWRVCREEQR